MRTRSCVYGDDIALDPARLGSIAGHRLRWSERLAGKARVQYFTVRTRNAPPVTLYKVLRDTLTPFKVAVLDIYAKYPPSQISRDQFSLMCEVVMDTVTLAAQRRRELEQRQDWSEDERVREFKRFLYPMTDETWLGVKRVWSHGPMRRRQAPARFWSRPRRRFFAMRPDDE